MHHKYDSIITKEIDDITIETKENEDIYTIKKRKLYDSENNIIKIILEGDLY